MKATPMEQEICNLLKRPTFWSAYVNLYTRGHNGYQAHKPEGTDPVVWSNWIHGTSAPPYKGMPDISEKMGVPEVELIMFILSYAISINNTESMSLKLKKWRNQVLSYMALSVSNSVLALIKKYLQSSKPQPMPNAVLKAPSIAHRVKVQANASCTTWRLAKQKYWNHLVGAYPPKVPEQLKLRNITQEVWDTWKTGKSLPRDDVMGSILHALGISFKDGWGLYEFFPPFSEGIAPSSSSALAQKRIKYFNSWPEELRHTTLLREELRRMRSDAKTERRRKRVEDDLAYAEECRNNIAELRAQPLTEEVQKQIVLNEANLRDAVYAATLVEQDKKRRAEWKEFQATKGAPPKYTIAPEEEDEPVVPAPAKTVEEPVAAATTGPLPLTTPLNKIRLPLIDLIPEDSPHHPFTCQEKIEALIAGKPVGDTAKRRDWWRSPTSDPYKDAYSKASTAHTALGVADLDLAGWAKALKHYYEEYAKLVAQLPDPDMAGERKFRVPKHLEQVLMSGVVIINDEGLPEISPFAVLL